MRRRAARSARSTARKSLTVGLGVGSQLPLHCSATGRVLLSSKSGADFESLFNAMPLSKLTPYTITDPVRLRKLLVSCADNGYALSNEEIEVGVRSIAVPLYNFGGSVVGALSLSSRADRMTASEMIEQLLQKQLADRGAAISIDALSYVKRRIERSYGAIEKFARGANAMALAENAPVNLALVKKVLEG